MVKIHRKRHIAKAVSYRLLGTLQTAIIGYCLTGSWKMASGLGFIELCIKPLVYYLHERVWYKWIRYGIKVEKN